MRSVFVSLATVALLAATAFGQLTINTPPSAVQCEPVQFTWSGGTAPYFLTILPGSQPGAPPLVDLGQQSGTSFTWLVNLQAGTSIGLTLRDSTGAVAQSAPFTIQSSSITACIGQSPSTTSGASTGTGTGAVTTPPVVTTPVATTPAATHPATVTSAPAGGGTTHAASSAAASASTKAGGASRMSEVGFAGIVGAAVVALFA